MDIEGPTSSAPRLVPKSATRKETRLKPVLEQELGLGGGAVVLFELRLSELEKLRRNCRPVLRPASAFPASLRDISMLAPADRPQEEAASDIRVAARAAAGWDILDELRLYI